MFVRSGEKSIIWATILQVMSCTFIYSLLHLIGCFFVQKLRNIFFFQNFQHQKVFASARFIARFSSCGFSFSFIARRQWISSTWRVLWAGKKWTRQIDWLVLFLHLEQWNVLYPPPPKDKQTSVVVFGGCVFLCCSFIFRCIQVCPKNLRIFFPKDRFCFGSRFCFSPVRSELLRRRLPVIRQNVLVKIDVYGSWRKPITQMNFYSMAPFYNGQKSVDFSFFFFLSVRWAGTMLYSSCQRISQR